MHASLSLSPGEISQAKEISLSGVLRELGEATHGLSETAFFLLISISLLLDVCLSVMLYSPNWILEF